MGLKNLYDGLILRCWFYDMCVSMHVYDRFYGRLRCGQDDDLLRCSVFAMTLFEVTFAYNDSYDDSHDGVACLCRCFCV